MKQSHVPGTERVGLCLGEGRLPDVGQDDVRAVAVVGRHGRVDVDGAASGVAHVALPRRGVLSHGGHVGALAQAPGVLGVKNQLTVSRILT